VPKPRNRLADYCQYLALRLLAMLVHMFDVRTNYRTARWLGELLWRIDRKHRRIATAHLRLSFPDWPGDRIDRVARKSFHNLAYLALEVLLTPRLVTLNRWRRHIRLREIAPGLRAVIRRDSGVILVTPHLGNWEIVGYTLAMLGFASVAVARPLDNPYVNDFIMGVRERTGMSVLGKFGAAGDMSAVLQRRGVLAFVADQDAGRRGVFVDFFGRPASTYRAIGLMALRHEVPILVAYGKRLSDRFEFEIGIARVIHPHEWADKDDELTWITQQFTTALEQVAREAPEQYLWAHRRWKHRPGGKKAAGDGIA